MGVLSFCLGFSKSTFFLGSREYSREEEKSRRKYEEIRSAGFWGMDFLGGAVVFNFSPRFFSLFEKLLFLFGAGGGGENMRWEGMV